MRSVLAGLAATASLLASVNAVNPVEVKEQEFVDSVTGSRFYIVGVDYQPGGEAGYDAQSGEDPLSNADNCLRDAALMQQLGVNTIRSYNLNPSANHDLCASIFNTAGIYMILDVNSPQASINRDDPSSTYTVEYLTRIFGIVEAFRNYPNVIGFFGANELVRHHLRTDVCLLPGPGYANTLFRSTMNLLLTKTHPTFAPSSAI